MHKTALQTLLVVGLGAAAKRSTPEEFDKLARDEIVTRTKVWAAAGVKVD